MSKARIKRSFSRAAVTYDECGALQAEVGRKLVDFIPAGLLPKVVLDAGCGTGSLLGDLSGRFSEASVIGCDIAFPMIGVARKKSNGNGARFVNSDFERFPFRDGSIDLVVSNLAYQWFTDIERAFAELSGVLAEGGRFVMSTLGPATLMELKASLLNAEEVLWLERTRLMNFMSMEALKEAAQGARLQIESISTERIVRVYADLWELLRALKGIGATNPNANPATLSNVALLKQTARFYKELFPSEDGLGIRATYDIIYMTASKPVAKVTTGANAAC